MEELIAKRYAKALASSVESVVDTASVLGMLSEALSAKEVSTALNSPLITVSQKSQMVLDALQGTDAKLQNFIKVLAEHGRLSLIPAIAKVLNADLQKEANNYEGVVKSANKVDAKTIASLEGTLKKKTGANIKLTHVDAELDGMLVAVEDLGIEVSFSKQRVKDDLIDFIKKSL